MSDWLDPDTSLHNLFFLEDMNADHSPVTEVVDKLLQWNNIEDVIEYLKSIIEWIASGTSNEPPNPRQFQKRLPL